MSALTFDKSELGNLEYSLQREMLATDRIGGYMSTTIVCCNTRRYHGLMVAPIDDSDASPSPPPEIAPAKSHAP